MENSNSVKNKLNIRTFKLINLPNLKFRYGEIDFFNEKTIDDGQAGFRFNAKTGEKIDEWVGDEYIIIGYDSTAGCGADPYIIKSNDNNLPVYWLMSDGGDWSNPDLICDSLENFNKIINVLNDYGDYFINEELTEQTKEEIINKICEIEEKRDISGYWNNLLDSAMPLDD